MASVLGAAMLFPLGFLEQGGPRSDDQLHRPPIAGLILAFAVLGERPLPLQSVGALVIVLGVRRAARSPALLSLRPHDVDDALPSSTRPTGDCHDGTEAQTYAPADDAKASSEVDVRRSRQCI